MACFLIYNLKNIFDGFEEVDLFGWYAFDGSLPIAFAHLHEDRLGVTGLLSTLQGLA